MNSWAIFKISIISIALFSSFAAPIKENNIGIGWEIVFVAFIIFPVIALIGRVIIFILPKIKNKFNKPSWSCNPFNFNVPENFFHLGGYIMLFSGLGEITSSLVATNALAPVQIATLVLGIGTLIGLQILTYRNHV